MDKLTARNMVMDSVQATGLTPDRFPVTMAGLASNPKRQAMFVDLLAKLKAAVESPQVIKARVTELREGLSRRLGDATRTRFRDDQYAADTPEAVKDLMHYGDLRGVAKAIKASKPFAGQNKHAGDVLAFYGEWEPIVAALESLKAKTTTTTAIRDEKKATEAKTKAAMPPSKLSPIVSAAVDAKKPELADSYRDFVTGVFNRFVIAFGPEFKGISNSQSYKTYQNTIWPVLGPDKKIDKAELDKKAKQYAEQVGEAMKDKIMAKAGELDSPAVKRMNGYSFLITGKRDGHDVVIEQNMIVNVSKLGTLFNQWPARIRVDGRAMSEAAYKSLK